MKDGLRIALLGVLVLCVFACAGGEPASDKTSDPGDISGEALVESADLGAADAFGPYRGDIGFGATVGGTLDTYTWHHIWSLTVGGGGESSARIDVKGVGNGTDTALYLFAWQNNRWRQIAFNDDCRRGVLDSCLQRTLPAGDYLVVVSTYQALYWGRYPNASYTLEVTCRSGGCANLLCGTDGRSDVPTDFVSADEQLSRPILFGGPTRSFEPTAELDEASSDRVVEEGDIYRVQSDGYIVNLNAYRGLQVIDVWDPANPEIVGRAQVSGTPVEMYIVDNFAYVLLNNWHGYYGLRDDIRVNAYEGGVLVAIDLADPYNPRVVSRQQVPGHIRTSRLTRGESGVAMYVAADETSQRADAGGLLVWQSSTVVSSFSLNAGAIQAQTRLDLGGSVTDVNATPEALLVARTDWSTSDRSSTVSVIDITDPTGAMSEGGEVTVAGLVENKTNMDLRGGVLRIVSGSTWGGTTTNHLQTFNAGDGSLAELDHCEFSDGERLFGTIFMDDRAFFVTYLQVDPFHAFAISADGACQEMSEFVVSGWNDFFRPVQGGERLIGIGMNDTAGRTMSVSLYDITNLNNREPLLARADVAADDSWSEATYDDRAFSVLENAVAVQAAGVVETGMVLLPFSGWSEGAKTYQSAVQLFTFSDHTLTRRGLMVHGTPVRRSFAADDATTANLSETELSLFDHTSPDLPTELGRVELAPNYTDFLVFGEFGARLNRSADAYIGWWGSRAELPPSTVQIVPMWDHADSARPVAEIEVPANAAIYRVGRLLVAVDYRTEEHPERGWVTTTAASVFDLTDPSAPEYMGTAETDALQPQGFYAGRIVCIRYPCFPTGQVDADVHAVGDALAFVQTTPQEETRPEGGRYWTSYTVYPLDLSHPEAPAFGEAISLPTSEEGVSVLADGTRLFLTVKRPEGADEEGRSQARFYLRTIDLATPSAPVLSEPINTPGELVAVDGATITTRDTLWWNDTVETEVDRAVVCDGKAYLQAGWRFEEQTVDDVRLDGAGHVLVSHRLAWHLANERGIDSPAQQLTILEGSRLTPESQFEVDSWATLRASAAGRALFEVPGGLLLVNTALGALPWAQAYFPVQGWPQDFHMQDNRLIFAAGRYGVYDFSLDRFNLL